MKLLICALFGVGVLVSCEKLPSVNLPPVSPITNVNDSTKLKLIAYYPFDNTAADLSGHQFNGTGNDITSVPDRFGKANAAYFFNGKSSYIIINDDSLLRLSQTNFTINYWVNIKTYSNSYGEITLAKRGVNQNDGWITGVGGQLDVPTIVGRAGSVTFNVSGGLDPFSYGLKVIPLNEWHMVTVTYDLLLATLTIYIDGVLDSSTSNMPSPNRYSNTPLVLGADSQGQYNPAFTDYLYNGSLDELRIYNRKLSISEINRLHDAVK